MTHVPPTRIHPAWRGHLFLFDRPTPAVYPARAGIRLLGVAAILEIALRLPLRAAYRRLDLPHADAWSPFLTCVLLAVGLLLVRVLARVEFTALGLRPWRAWTLTERLYFVQVVPLAIGVFTAALGPQLVAVWRDARFTGVAPFVLGQLLWGFYQELVYRGLVQTALVRRLGAWRGVLGANVLFTFGPLHSYHFGLARADPSHLWIFAAIFAIGLFFGVLYQRSANLWIVGVMHGIGDAFMSAASIR